VQAAITPIQPTTDQPAPSGARAVLDVEPYRAALLEERRRLLAEADALRADERALSDSQAEEGGISGDSADVASDLAEQELDQALERTVRDRVADVDLALARMQRGVYGQCEECGEPIAPDRLTARPWARRCLACQQWTERRAPRRR